MFGFSSPKPLIIYDLSRCFYRYFRVLTKQVFSIVCYKFLSRFNCLCFFFADFWRWSSNDIKSTDDFHISKTSAHQHARNAPKEGKKALDVKLMRESNTRIAPAITIASYLLSSHFIPCRNKKDTPSPHWYIIWLLLCLLLGVFIPTTFPMLRYSNSTHAPKNCRSGEWFQVTHIHSFIYPLAHSLSLHIHMFFPTTRMTHTCDYGIQDSHPLYDSMSCCICSTSKPEAFTLHSALTQHTSSHLCSIKNAKR